MKGQLGFVNNTALVELKGVFLRDLGKILLKSVCVQNPDIDEKVSYFKKYFSVTVALEHTLAVFFARVCLTEFYIAGSWQMPKTRASYDVMLSSVLSAEWQKYLGSKYETFKLIPQITEHFYSGFSELKNRFENDKSLLVEKGFLQCGDELVDVVPAGDYHANGKVSLLVFQSGHKLVYKPHNVGNLEFISRVFELVNKQSGLELRVPRSLGNEDYHWQEFVDNSAEGLQVGYVQSNTLRELGAILAVGVWLGFRDLHIENIVFADGKPVVIDYECVAMPYLSGEVTGLAITPADIGILPQNIGFAGFKSKLDWSLFGNPVDEGIPAWGQHNFVDEGLPTVRMVEPVDEEHRNQNQQLGVHEIDEICAGYKLASDVLADIDFSNLLQFADEFQVASRAVLRATQLYANCMRRATYPQYMQKISAHRDKYKELLADIGVSNELIDFEVDELVMRRIPLFEASFTQGSLLGTKIVSPDKVLEKQFVRQRSYGQVDKDIRYIKQIFESIRKYPLEMPLVDSVQTFEVGKSIEGILAGVVDEICKNATWVNDIPVWSNLTKTNSGDWVIDYATYSLYHGGAGVFLALAAAKSAGIEFSAEHNRVYESLRQALTNYIYDDSIKNSLGFYDGISGAIYALVQDSSNEVVLKLFNRLYELVLARQDFEEFDVISGVAGILGLVSEGRLRGYAPDKAILAEKKLISYLETTKSFDDFGNIKWEDTAEWVGGFAHGPLGVAWAVSRTSFAAQYRNLVKQALKAHLSLYDESQDIWYRFAKGSELNISAWCHGGEGFVQAVSSMQDLLSEVNAEEIYKKELETLCLSELPDDITVCHGLCGRLLAVSKLSDTKFREGKDILENYLPLLLDSKLCLSDGFMVGRAGVLFTASKLLLGADVDNPLFMELGD